MPSPAKREVFVGVRPTDIKDIPVLEFLIVSVGRSQSDQKSGPGRQINACPLYGPSPERKAVCRSEGEAGCSHIFGLFKELHSTLRALMEIRAPSPGQLSG